MLVVDSHCHVSPIWYEPVETLLFEMDRNQVDRAVMIQMQGQTDNSYQQACLHRYSDRLASVVLVDPGHYDAPAQLRRLAEDGATGVRLRAALRSPGEDPLAIWRAAALLGMAIGCPADGPKFDAAAFSSLLEALPTLTVVLEHLGASSLADADNSSRIAVFGLARFPNVYIKVPGLGELARRAMPPRDPFPFAEPIPPYLRQAFDAFGPNRMMWGSDFPPVAGREGYTNALRLCQAQLESEAPEARAAIFGDAAARVFFRH